MKETGDKELLKIRQVSKTYRSHKKHPVYALREADFSLDRGSCLGVVGESGCGKSTLCRIVAGMEKPDTGAVFYEGERADYKKNRSRIQMVFQNSMDAVNIHLNAGRIISEPLENFTSLGRMARERQVEQLMELVGLSGEDKTKYPRQFSGGQLQRICIARALAAKPEVLILDEPLSSLDVSVQAQLLNLLSDLKQELGLTCLLVSHDLEAVYYLADKLLVMYGGTIVEELADIKDFKSLRHPYTRLLLDAGVLEGRPLWTGMEEKTAGSTAKGCVYAAHCPWAKEKCFSEWPRLAQKEAGHRVACHLL